MSTSGTEAPAEMARRLDGLVAQNDQLEGTIQDARSQIVELAETLSSTRQQIEDQRRELHLTRVELARVHRALAATTTELAGVLGSRTWRLSAPARRVLGRSR